MIIKNKKRITLGLISCFALIVPVTLISCSSDNNDTFKNFNVKSDFDNTIVKNNNMIKGVDVSSYTSVLSNYLNQQNIMLNNNDGSQVFNASTEDNIYSYIDQNGQRIYGNLFKILKEQAGINSIRLRVFVDPKDANNKYYTSGVNSTIESTIWTINKAKENGINHFQLNFHYSDFWADPNRQFVPKSWSNLNTDQMIQTIEDYTYNSILKVYQETGLFPASVQVGNEITNGMIWRTDSKNQVFYDDNRNIENSTLYFNAGAKGVKRVNEYIKTNNINHKIETVIHIESPQIKGARERFQMYMSNQELLNNVDIVGLTYYPFWNGNIDSFYTYLKNFYNQYDKKIYIEEFSLPYTLQPSYYLGDLTMQDMYGRVPATPEGQIIVTNSFLEAISKAFPNMETGFYYWEPAWLNIDYSTWATPEGIKYAENYDYQKIIKQKDGNSWSNQGLFDRNGILLPVAKAIKNFSRTKNDQFTKINIDTKTQFNQDIVSPTYDSYSIINSYIGNHSPLYLDQNDFYKTPILNELYEEFTGIYTQEIDYYVDDINNVQLSIDQIKEILKEKYQRIMWHHVSLENLVKNQNTYSIDIVSNQDSYHYKGSAKININLHEYNNNNINLTNKPLQLNYQDTDWSWKVIEHIKNNVAGLEDLIYSTFNLSGGINGQNQFWLYDDKNKVDRYTDWLLLKNSKIFFKDQNTTELDHLNKNLYDWPTEGYIDNILDSNQNFYFGIKKQLNDLEFNNDKDLTYKPSIYSLVGKESWKYVNVMVFKLKILIP